jgi:hypothetical protein
MFAEKVRIASPFWIGCGGGTKRAITVRGLESSSVRLFYGGGIPMSKLNHSVSICALAVFCLIAFGPNSCDGEILTLQMCYTYGGTGAAGTAPWLTAVFDDEANPGYVTMTLTATNLRTSPLESVDEWYLNVDPSIVPSSLTFSLLATIGKFVTPTINTGADDAYKADGDGYYDIEVAFNHTDGADKRFTNGDSVTYKVSGVSSADAFNFFSTPGPGGNPPGPFKMAAHIQGTGGDGSSSGWVAPSVPEPSSFVLGGIAAGVLCFYIRRQRKAS